MRTMSSKDANRSLRAGGRRWMVLAIVVVLALGVGVASAAAAGIEGVWKFGGGEIDIQEVKPATAPASYEGIVTEPTKFAECTHPVSQRIWTKITAQPNGSYDGLHQWYIEKSGCKENPELGLAAFRVLTEPDGNPYLDVCLSNPGSTEQPVIEANGAHPHTTYGCIPSEHTSELPVVGPTPGGPGTTTGTTTGTGEVKGVIEERLTLPGAKQCLSGRRFEIHLAEPKYDPFKTVSVTLKGHKIATAHRGNFVVATINLAGLKRGKFTIVIHATTVLGHHLSGSRTYHTCAKKAKHDKPSKLH